MGLSLIPPRLSDTKPSTLSSQKRQGRQAIAMPSPIEKVECLVIGGGVIGLAVARALALRGREWLTSETESGKTEIDNVSKVLVCEKERAVGQGTTSRNSGVIHAGLYYTPGSLKARLCVEGRNALYRYCSSRGVPHRRCGKLVVASAESQLPALRALHEQAMACGVKDVRMVSQKEARDMEPQVLCTEAVALSQHGWTFSLLLLHNTTSAGQALLSPSTGIVDTHELVQALQGDAEAGGAVVSLRTPVHGATGVSSDGSIITTVDGMDLKCGAVINCAGLSAIDFASGIGGLDTSSLPKVFYAKGNYFQYTGAPPFQRLVYPLPEPRQAGLGVHATLDLAGQVRFGPDVEWVRPTGASGEGGFDYVVDPRRSSTFCDAIRRYWPALDESKLVPDYSGIRPKLIGPNASLAAETSGRGVVGATKTGARGAADFAIQGPGVHGVKGLMNLLGIESPGLTASLAIADHVADMLEHS